MNVFVSKKRSFLYGHKLNVVNLGKTKNPNQQRQTLNVLHTTTESQLSLTAAMRERIHSSVCSESLLSVVLLLAGGGGAYRIKVALVYTVYTYR